MNALDISPITLIIGYVSKWLTGYLRGARWFGFFNEESKGRVHIVNGVVATILTGVTLYLTGELDQTSLQTAIEFIFNSIMSYTSGVAYYEIENATAKVKA
jgi:hypothetical protein